MTDQQQQQQLSPALITFKKSLTQIHHNVRSEKDIDESLRWIENLISQIKENDERFDAFLKKLYKIVSSILCRGDYEDAMIPRISAFLKRVTTYLVQFIPLENETVFKNLILLFSYDEKYLLIKTYWVGREYKASVVFETKDVYTNDDWNVSKVVYANINSFIIAGGHTKCLELIEREKRISVTSATNCVNVLERVYDMLAPDITKKFFDPLTKALFKFIEEIPDEEIKNTDKKVVMDMIENCKKFLTRFLHPNLAGERVDKFRIWLATRWLQLPFLNKRLEGLNDLSYYCKTAMQKPVVYNNQKKEPEIFVESAFLRDWLQKNKIIEILFGKGSHVELMRRASDILQILSPDIQKAHIDLIWESSQGQHESIIHQVWVILGRLSVHITLPLIEYLYEKMKQLPFSAYDSQYLSFLQSVTENGIINAAKYGQRKFFAIDLFWQAIQDNSGVSVEIVNHCLMCLAHFIESDRYDRDQMIKSCIENLQKVRSVPQSLRILTFIIGSFKSTAKDDKIVAWMEDTQNLSKLFFDTLDNYCNEVLQLKDKVDTGGYPENYIFKGYHSHYEYIQNLLGFIQFVWYRSQSRCNIKFMDILWKSTITNTLSDHMRNLAFDWLKLVVEYLPTEVVDHIFSKCVPTLDFKTLAMSTFSFIQSYFYRINQLQNRITLKAADEIIINNFELIGIDFFWRILFEAEIEGVGTEAVEMLTKIQKNTSPSLLQNLVNFRESYLKIAMDALASASSEWASSKSQKAEIQIDRSLKFLRSLIRVLEASAISEKHGNVGAPIQLKIKFLQGTEHIIEIHSNETIGDLKQKFPSLCDDPNTPIDRYSIIVSGKEFAEDSMLIKDTPFQNGSLLNVIKRNQPRNPSSVHKFPTLSEEEIRALPSSILSHEKYFEQFFMLLNILPANFCSQIWEILEKLPTNLKLKMAFQELPTNPNPNWASLLDPQSIFKLYYSLQIVGSFTQPPKEDALDREQKLNWSRHFVRTGGLAHLVNILMKTDFFSSSQGNKRFLCYAYLLRSINFFVVEPETPQQPPTLRPDIIPTFPAEEITQKLIFTIETLSGDQESHSDGTPSPFSPKTDVDHVVIAVTPLLTALVLANNHFLQFVVQKLDKNFISKVLLFNQLQPSREAFANSLIQICRYTTVNNPVGHFLKLFLEFINSFEVPPEKVHEHPFLYTCAEWFKVLIFLISSSKTTHIEALLDKVVEMLKIHPIVEVSNLSPEDKILEGLFDLCRALFEIDQSKKTIIGQELIPKVFDEFLFDIPTIGRTNNPPKCKTSGSRRKAFGFLMEMVKNSPPNLQLLCGLLIHYHAKQSFKKQWQYSPLAYEKSNGFVGLKNLGATCYMNSLVQQFFMVPQFRYKLLSLEDKSPDFSDSVLYQLQSIFSYLQESEKKYYDTKNFCKAYKVDGEPMKIFEQMDVDEFFANLLDKLDSYLKNTPEAKLIQDFFGISIVNQIISKECDHSSERAEVSFNLQLEVKNKKKLQESLDLFVQGDMLDGDNKYFCGKCNSKVDALKRCCIGSLPNYLFIHLKRFEFDFDLMRRAKVNQYCEFPTKLNLEPYTVEGLARKEKAEPTEPKYPLSHYDYDLTGILVHNGTTESGHYYSFIKDSQSNQWFQFNDTQITPFDANDIPDQCFGGVETQRVGRTTRTVQKTYNAYLLIYERSCPEKPVVENPIPIARQSSIVPKELYNQVWDKNMKFSMDKHLFDGDYFSFVKDLLSYNYNQNLQTKVPPIQSLIGNWTSGTELPEIGLDPLFCTIQLGTRFLIQTLSHSYDKRSLPDVIGLLKNLYGTHYPACQWLYCTLRKDPQWIKELFFNCNVPETREQFCKLIIHIGSLLDPLENSSYSEIIEEEMVDEANEKMEEEEAEEEVAKKTALGLLRGKLDSKFMVVGFIETLLKMVFEAKNYWRNYSHFWLLFKEFVGVSVPLKQYMLSNGYLLFFYHLVMGEDSKFAPKKAKDTGKTKEKIAQERTALFNMKHLVGAIVEIIRSVNIKRNTESPSPNQAVGDILHLPEQEEELLLSRSFITKAIFCDYSTESMSIYASHICWENKEHSIMILDLICDTIDKENTDKFPPYFNVLKTVLSMQDSLQNERISYGLQRLLEVIDKNLNHKPTLISCINFFAEYVLVNSLVRDFVLFHIDLCVGKWLLFTEKEGDGNVRMAAELLILELVPENLGYIIPTKTPTYPSSMKSLAQKKPPLPVKPLPLPPNQNVPLPPTPAGPSGPTNPVGYLELPVEAKSRLNIVLHSLLRSLESITSYSAPIYENPNISSVYDLDTANYRLVPLFRLLQWATVSSAEQDAILQGDHKKNFLQLGVLMNDAKIDYDLNKMEYFKYWDKLLENNSQVQALFAEDTECRNLLFQNYIKAGNSKIQLSYNNFSLEPYFKMFLKLLTNSNTFRKEMMDHGNFAWSLRYMYIEGKEMPNLAVILSEIIEQTFNYPELKLAWPTLWIKDLQQSRTVAWVPCFTLLARILKDQANQQRFCKIQGIYCLSESFKRPSSVQWSLDELEIISRVSALALTWGTVQPLDEPSKELKKAISITHLDNIFSRLSSYVSVLKVEHIQAGKSIVEFIDVLLKFDKPSYFKKTLDVLTNSFTSPVQFHPKNILKDEWRQLLIQFASNLCTIAIAEKDPRFKLVQSVVLESLMHPIDIIIAVVKDLEKLKGVVETMNIPEYSQSFNSIINEFLPKLLFKHHTHLDLEPIYTFAYKYFPTITPTAASVLLTTASNTIDSIPLETAQAGDLLRFSAYLNILFLEQNIKKKLIETKGNTIKRLQERVLSLNQQKDVEMENAEGTTPQAPQLPQPTPLLTTILQIVQEWFQ